MKPNLIKRVAAAVALAALAAMVSACGSSGGSATGIVGPSIANGSGCTGLSQAVAFSGVAAEDQYGDIDAGQTVGPLTLSAVGTASPGGYEFGRINTTDGSTLEFNVSGGGAYGAQLSIQGMYIMGQDVYGILQTMGGGMGYGYSYPTAGYSYGSTGCGVSSIAFSLGFEPAAEAAQVVGEQPFEYVLTSSAVTPYSFVLNNEIQAPY